jgi:hypothetical protein
MWGKNIMKYSKRFQACVGGVVLAALLYMVTPINTMISEKSTSKRIRVQQPYSAKATKGKPDRYKSEIVWVKTSDGMLLEVPQWQIDQSKVLQLFFVHQKGGNSKDNPINAFMITSKQLVLLQEALRKASNLKIFREFYISLSGAEQKSLLADAFSLEMQGLASLIMSYMFPMEVQQQMGANVLQQSGIIAPVVAYLQNPEKIVLPHKGMVKEIAFSSDGNRIISAAYGIDHNLILYDFKNRKVIKNLVVETFLDPCVAFSPDGNYVVAGSQREFDTLILFDAITGEPIRIFGKERRPVNCVTFSADGNFILAGSGFGYSGYKPILYDVKTGKILSAYKEAGIISHFTRLPNSFEDYWHDKTEYITYIPNSNDVIVGVQKDLSVYDCKTYELKKTIYLHGLYSEVSSIAFSVDRKYCVGGSYYLVLWNVETGEIVQKFEPQGHITCVAFHPSNDYIVAGYTRGHDQYVKILMFDCNTGKPIKKFKRMTDVNCVVFSPDGNSLLCGGSDGLMLFKLINKKTLGTIATQLNIAQARLLYRLYLAKINNTPVILDVKDLDYQIFITLPADVQQVVKIFLPFELSGDIVGNELQQKITELRSSLFYHTSLIWGPYEKKHDEKVKAVKDAMQKFEKNSVAYKACVELLAELEMEEAFK